jgi:hypothetical protein
MGGVSLCCFVFSFRPSFFLLFFTSSSSFVFLVLVILSNLGGECVPTGKLCERFVRRCCCSCYRPSCWLFLSRSPSSSSFSWFFFFIFFLTFPHVCYIVDRRKLTTNPTDRPLQSTLDGKQQQSGTHNFPQTILILSL